MGADIAHLEALYAASPDPWGFRSSGYEHAKFEATVASLSRPSYGAVLEIGCGNGELGRRLSRRCDRYVGVDAVERAIAEAQKCIPCGEFHQAFFPCALPSGSFDLVVVSEFLYFLDASAVAELARQVGERWPDAEIVCVNYLGPTGHVLQGELAADLFVQALGHRFRASYQEISSNYRIDRLTPANQSGRSR